MDLKLLTHALRLLFHNYTHIQMNITPRIISALSLMDDELMPTLIIHDRESDYPGKSASNIFQYLPNKRSDLKQHAAKLAFYSKCPFVYKGSKYLTIEHALYAEMALKFEHPRFSESFCVGGKYGKASQATLLAVMRRFLSEKGLGITWDLSTHLNTLQAIMKVKFTKNACCQESLKCTGQDTRLVYRLHFPIHATHTTFVRFYSMEYIRDHCIL